VVVSLVSFVVEAMNKLDFGPAVVCPGLTGLHYWRRNNCSTCQNSPITTRLLDNCDLAA